MIKACVLRDLTIKHCLVGCSLSSRVDSSLSCLLSFHVEKRPWGLRAPLLVFYLGVMWRSLKLPSRRLLPGGVTY